ncbi:hypothetical protein C5Y96_23530 [Blastopirellula marina]|uniref:Uncharacterized protein n=1 Tax=Blastopirellula marina TaxID=124 RepID=A0A2S8F1I1_9BACT|nr:MULTISPECIES: hypothetical protein [Pirellulaceae]PQO25784.1 hypothetical protein C5Y96_23530 [Blastopirellula marina]RCS43467.1 hypothetical protein DTL36_23580 [Bremerella cremea]
MPDKFDPYRESLIVEEKTIWPEALSEVPLEKRGTIARQLHADAASCNHLEYVRLHTGFCRQITVTQQDVTRLEAKT